MFCCFRGCMAIVVNALYSIDYADRLTVINITSALLCEWMDIQVHLALNDKNEAPSLISKVEPFQRSRNPALSNKNICNLKKYIDPKRTQRGALILGLFCGPFSFYLSRSIQH